MTIYNFLAALAGCATAVLIVWMLLRTPICIKFMKVDAENVLKHRCNCAEKCQESDEKVQKSDEKVTEIDEKIAKNSMDAVIKAANNLMGIESVEEDDNDRQE